MKCKFCRTVIENPVFNIGSTAISNDLVSADRLNESEKTYPLVLYVCPKCFLAQIERHKEGHEIFRDEYVYFSSYSSYWLEHAKKYVDNIIDRLNLNKNSFVIEVASNDGYLLTNFVARGIKCLGIEPTYSTASEAIKNSVPTLIEFFNIELTKKIIEDKGRSDLVIANNVLAHVPDINDFVASLKNILSGDGTITIEFPHLMHLLERNEFDTIYHEHFFYFSILSLIKIFPKHGLSIYDVEELETHGGSLRIYATHCGNAIDKGSDKKNVDRVLEKEVNCGLKSLDYYNKLRINSFNIKLNALQYLINNKLKGNTIIAFGAAAKGNTFLNYCGVKSDIIDAVIDETPAKIGKYMPQSKIPILPFSSINNLKPNIIIILPWNHQDEILEKLRFTKKWNCEIIVFIPKLEVLQ
ncbi:class I SAM-dependent methyltransferase [Candidatus Woesearchaeota archaeon]|jgi:SAM-dependent methyltransferase|nr:class I SAM-dependent methyltransferase [Candidatus Woesearchaeota archaeon]